MSRILKFVSDRSLFVTFLEPPRVTGRRGRYPGIQRVFPQEKGKRKLLKKKIVRNFENFDFFDHLEIFAREFSDFYLYLP